MKRIRDDVFSFFFFDIIRFDIIHRSEIECRFLQKKTEKYLLWIVANTSRVFCRRRLATQTVYI